MEWKTREFLVEHGFTTRWMPKGGIFLDAAYTDRNDCSYSHCIYPKGGKWVFATWINAKEAQEVGGLAGLSGMDRWKTIIELPTRKAAKAYAEVTIKMEKSL